MGIVTWRWEQGDFNQFQRKRKREFMLRKGWREKTKHFNLPKKSNASIQPVFFSTAT